MTGHDIESSAGRRTVGPHFARRFRDALATVSLGFLVIASPQLLGGAQVWGALCIGCMSALAATLVWWDTRTDYLGVRLPRLSLWLGVPLAWTVLQAIPVPCASLALFAPRVVADSLGTLELLPGSTPTCTLSYDPGGTRIEVLKGLVLLAAMMCGWLLAAEGRRRTVLKLVGLSAVTMAGIALGHRIAAAENVFGLYEPQDVVPPIWGPLLNPNHLSGFLSMGLPCVLVLGMSSRAREVRWSWLCGAALITCVAIATLSRTGVAGLVISQAALFWLVRRKQGGGERRSAAAFWALVGAMVVAVLLNASSLRKEAESKDVAKLELIADSFRFSLEQPWRGVGRGAFSAAFVSTEGISQRFVYPESLPVQWVSEWGYPIGLFTLAIVTAMWARALYRARSLERIAALVGVGAIALHDLLDFTLEMVGIAVVAALLMGAGVAPRHSPRTRVRTPREGGPAVATACLGVAVTLVVGVLALGPSLLRTDLTVAPRTLERMMEANVASAPVHTLLRESLEAHPNEPRLTLLAAHVPRDRVRPDVLRWLNRTMQLAPGWSAPHVLAARWLHNRGRDLQALLEVREANARLAASGRSIMCEILMSTSRPVWLVDRTLPRESATEPYLRAAIKCMADKPAVVARLDALWLREVPDAIGPRLREAHRSFRSGDNEKAITQLREVVDAHPAHRKARHKLAHTLFRSGRIEAALNVLGQWPRKSLGQGTLKLRGRIEAALGLRKEVHRTLGYLKAEAAGDISKIAQTLDFRSSLEQRMGNLEAALEVLEEATRIQPTVNRLKRLAKIAHRTGARFREREAYIRLCELRPSNEEFCRSAEGRPALHP